GVLVEVGPAHRRVPRSARHEVPAQIVARVEDREEPEVLLFRAGATVDEREPGNAERVAGNRQWPAIGTEDDGPAGRALKIARRIVEWPSRLDVGLLGPKAPDEFQAATEKLGVSAKKGGGDGFA